MYAPGSAAADTYICYVSALQYLFVRNFTTGEMVKRIALMHFPTCLSLVDFAKVAQQFELSVQGGGLQALAFVGT